MHLRSHNLLQKTVQIVPKQRQSMAAKAKQVAAVKSPLKRSRKAEQVKEDEHVKAEPVSDVKQEILNHTITPIKLEYDVKAEISSELHATPAKRAKREPENWKLIWDKIKTMREEHPAAVDSEGCETFNDLTLDPPVRRFHVLVACMLSSQTKDPVTAAAMGRLRAHGLTIDSMLEIDEKELANILRPVGFFNNKAKYIKQTCAILQEKYGSDIPPTYDELVALPGVGPKMAHLTMSCAWENTVGICVDVHVHRISNRLGWAHTWSKNGKSQDPEKTRRELEEWLPYEHWNDINMLLVGFGQQICLPVNPKCAECSISDICPSAFKKKSP
ncbi:hypothetical protein LEN26_007530 [Aphanomyces euteiches]|nr:hypothetical protein AeMF1_010418 [Aphanomyces euteiches]KAH9132010.1 hypothetical protein LEN26_007530 [Aphanomyces euteiches]KAH9193546.1 hypothetical protein AeNC1_004469 [Aphanomyces euteiches]